MITNDRLDVRELRFGPVEEMFEEQVGDLLLHRVLTQPRMQVGEIDAVQFLILVVAGEDEFLAAGRRIDVALQTLRADFLHHALHRRVDAADATRSRLQIRRQRRVARRLFTAAIIRSDPMAMIRFTVLQRNELGAEPSPA